MRPGRRVVLVLWLHGCAGAPHPDLDPEQLERGPVADVLLGAGHYPVGFTSTTLYNGTRAIDVMVWYPARFDPRADVARYPQYVPLPSPQQAGLKPGPLYEVDGLLDASAWAEALDANVPADPGPWEPLWPVLVKEGVAAAGGRHPVVVNLAGGNSPAFVATYEATQYASHGIVFVSVASQFTNTPVTVPDSMCPLARDADVALDEVLGWNGTPGHVLEGAMDLDAVFGSGHSFGGRTWVSRTSDVTECGLPREDRIAGLFLKDATWERLTLAQMQGNTVPTLLSSQRCRQTQIDLQASLASAPTMIMLDGYTPLPSNDNHALFAQSCLSVYANAAGGVPDFLAAVPPVRRLRCDDTSDATSGDDDAFYVERERFFAAQNSKYGIAWVESVAGRSVYGAAFQPWNTHPGVTIVPADGPGIEAYCP